VSLDQLKSERVQRLADISLAKNLRIGAAESLTGGAITSALAMGESAADWFQGGIVAYRPEVKFDLLGVEPGPLVTDACAAQMASGAAKALEAHAVVSTTGVGGPDPEEGHPPGTVHVGVWLNGELSCHRLEIDAEDPGRIVEETTTAALGLLLDALAG
jgi:nicotinamide-nucleotide amidase